MNPRPSSLSQAQGAVLLLLLLALSMVLATFLVSSLNRGQVQAQSDKETYEALREAKEALINAAVSVHTGIDASNRYRPGELLCPDRNPPGSAQSGRSGLAGFTDCTGNAQLIGRIPWYTLGLSRYKDGSGETLWYMVADPFQEDPDQSSINSTTVNTTPNSLQAFSNGGGTALTTAGNQAIAIIFAPGSALTGQNRNTAPQQTNPANYLERVAPPNATANFNNASTNPAIPRIDGPIRNAAGTMLLNDRLIVITRDEVMNRVRKRAAREYPLALAKQGKSLSAACMGALPAITLGDQYDWLTQNNWNTILRYKSPCTNPPVLE